ncbi:hypothetical protein Peur_047098 [Populus x canadensis]
MPKRKRQPEEDCSNSNLSHHPPSGPPQPPPSQPPSPSAPRNRPWIKCAVSELGHKKLDDIFILLTILAPSPPATT